MDIKDITTVTRVQTITINMGEKKGTSQKNLEIVNITRVFLGRRPKWLRKEKGKKENPKDNVTKGETNIDKKRKKTEIKRKVKVLNVYIIRFP